MSSYLFLLPLSLGLGVIGLLTFIWTMRKDQYEDLDGAAYRILDEDDFPLLEKTELGIGQCNEDKSTAEKQA